MNINACISEKIFDRVLGGLFLLLAVTFVAVGFTVLPILGFVLAVPAFLAGVSFIKKSPSDVCPIS